MKRFITLFAAMMTMAFAAPAMAESGPRVGLEVGVVGDDFGSTDKVTYGVAAGYDFDLGNVIVGPAIGYTKLLNDDGLDLREIDAGARVGIKAGKRTTLYGAVAYSNLDASGLTGSLDGVRFGLGIERKLGTSFYANAETRYGNYEFGEELYQTLIGVGVRF